MTINLLSDLGFRPPDGQDPDQTRGAFDQIDTRIRRATGNLQSVAEAVEEIQGAIAGLEVGESVTQQDIGEWLSGIEVENNGAVYVLAGTNAKSPQWSTINSVFAESNVLTNLITTTFTTVTGPGFASIDSTETTPTFVLVGTATKLPQWMSPATFFASQFNRPFTELGSMTASPAHILVSSAGKLPMWMTKSAFENHFAPPEPPITVPQNAGGLTFPLSNNYSGWAALPNNHDVWADDMKIMSLHFDGYINHYANVIHAIVEALKRAKILT